jgi:hypothetical protein
MIVSYFQTAFAGQTNIALAYIYCDYKDQKQTAANLIGSLLQQLVEGNPTISDETLALYRHHTMRNSKPTLEELFTCLQSEARHSSRVFVIIDALDECSEDSGTRDSFVAGLGQLKSILHLLVTSRLNFMIDSIESDLRIVARVDIYARSEDIVRYLQYRIHRSRKYLQMNSDLRDDIIGNIVKEANGM